MNTAIKLTNTVPALHVVSSRALADASDDTLLALARDGSRPAIDQLHRRHARPLVAWLRARNLRRDADDVVQDVFLILLTQPGSLPATGKVIPWLRGIAYRVARKKNALLCAEDLVASVERMFDPYDADTEGVLAEPENRRPLRF